MQKLHLIMSADYGSLHQQIMNLDSGIRLVTICTNDGKIMHSDHREGVRNMLTPEESKRSLELAINAWKTRSELAPKIGRGKYVLAEYERIKRITMPLSDNKHLVYITTEIPSDHTKIINGVMQLKF
jgi:plasmid stability protein